MFSLAAGALTPNDITVFLLAVAVLLMTARVLGELVSKVGQPAILGELLAGVLLGPTILGAISPDMYGWLFPVEEIIRNDAGEIISKTPSLVKVGLDLLLTLAICLLLLVAGLEVDLASLRRQGKAAVSVSLAGMVVPFALGAGTIYLLPSAFALTREEVTLPAVLFVGIAMSITALPVIAKILMDLNALKTDLGMLIMSAAMVNDLIGWLGFALVLALMAGGDTVAAEAAGAASDAVANGAANAASVSVAKTVVLTLLFVGLMLTVGRWITNRLLPFIQAHTAWPGGPITMLLVLALFGAAFTEWIGIHSIFGAFIVGVAIGDSKHLRERTRVTIEQFVTNFFSPLFFASIGLYVDFLGAFNPLVVAVVLIVAIIGKLVGCYAGARITGMPQNSSMAVGVGMCARGAMEIILAQLALDAGLIGTELFVAIVIMALVTSMFPGPILARLLAQKKALRLADLLTERGFILRLSTADREAVLREMSKAASDVTGSDAETIFQAAWAREQSMPTGLEAGLAVPHARVPGLKRPSVVVGISEQGVDFDARDGEPARLIFLLLAPAEQPTMQIELLRLISSVFMTPDTRQRARHVEGFTEFKALISTAEAPAH